MIDFSFLKLPKSVERTELYACERLKKYIWLPAFKTNKFIKL